MSFVENQIMNTHINKLVVSWLKRHPQVKQWLWFVALWVSGLLAVSILTYPIKLIVNFCK
jgi:hypothetical protein